MYIKMDKTTTIMYSNRQLCEVRREVQVPKTIGLPCWLECGGKKPGGR